MNNPNKPPQTKSPAIRIGQTALNILGNHPYWGYPPRLEPFLVNLSETESQIIDLVAEGKTIKEACLESGLPEFSGANFFKNNRQLLVILEVLVEAVNNQKT